MGSLLARKGPLSVTFFFPLPQDLPPKPPHAWMPLGNSPFTFLAISALLEKGYDNKVSLGTNLLLF